mgnify:CR=1 FL=1
MIGRVRESRNPKKVIRVALMESYGEIGRVHVNLLFIIRYSKKVAENTFMRKPIYEYSPCCGAAQGYKKFVTAYTGKAR